MSNEPADQQGEGWEAVLHDSSKGVWVVRKGRVILSWHFGVNAAHWARETADKLTALETENAALKGQLDAYWRQYRSCPCSARGESPSTFPHVPGCPTEKALSRLTSTGGEA